MNLFQMGNFTFHSGAKSHWKFDCDALTAEDWETITDMIVQRVSYFSRVIGIPRGGTKLAELLKPFENSLVDRLLIIDDVYTTGASMEKAKIENTTLTNQIIGVVVFARDQTPDWILPILTLGNNWR